MILIKETATLQQHFAKAKLADQQIGFVPTMGALHQGHISLITKAKSENELVVCSIFVNPTQFNNSKDFDKYPITIEKDIALLHDAGCDILFLPSVKEIYPTGIQVLKHYDLGFIEKVYDGAFRPGHFQGVCNVVQRLFEIVTPNNAYFGLKDYQQCMVIQKLVSLMQWQDKLKLLFCDTLREIDGLAMSSRNMRLTVNERQTAPIIYQTLLWIKKAVTAGDLAPILKEAKNKLMEKGLQPDYVDIADATTLEPVTIWNGKQQLICLVAAFLNEVRLIDNMKLND
jgi:pantoate--beta-alanine ligase